MSPDRSSIADTAVDTAADAARIAHAVTQRDARDNKTLLERVRDGYAGWPAGGGFDAVRSGPKTTLHCFRHGNDDCDCGQNTTIPGANDPTGNAAIRPDRARDDLKAFEKHLRSARQQLDQALQIVQRWSPRAANVIEQAAGTTEPGCVSCARVPGPSGAPWWNPVEREVTLNDGARVGLCSWCRQTPVVGAKHSGDMPPKDEVAYYRDNGRARKRSA